MSAGIAHDMSRKLQQSLGDVLQRELNIARHGCSLPEIGLMMIEASVMMARTTAGTIANVVDDDADIPRIVDMTVDGIIQQIRSAQGDIASRVLAERRERAA